MQTNKNRSLTGNQRSEINTYPPPAKGGTKPITAYDINPVV